MSIYNLCCFSPCCLQGEASPVTVRLSPPASQRSSVVGSTGATGLVGTVGVQGATGATGPGCSLNPDIHVYFSLGKTDTQSITSDTNFTYHDICCWGVRSGAMYASSAPSHFDETSGVFRAPVAGKYLFVANIVAGIQQGGPFSPGSVLCLRLTSNINFQLCEHRVNATTAWDPNSGVCLQLSHVCQLSLAEQVTLQLAYVIPLSESSVDISENKTVSIDPFLGLTNFQGILLVPDS